ncbi:unnamed protein product [Chondrus crispus]|uniref:Uncharacterized protein n=1 Tax=Chondrus crispus TaxID=2769 RepID=R7Q5S1_CHOCR|nr:unnamed protein product [Chondrus crispus]CDF33877.1 unnamed protein product [Chondrus crispus]|eukprot:XP_005713696.1 unnamed protein product [Chondrus crispus]
MGGESAEAERWGASCSTRTAMLSSPKRATSQYIRPSP